MRVPCSLLQSIADPKIQILQQRAVVARTAPDERLAQDSDGRAIRFGASPTGNSMDSRCADVMRGAE